MIVRYPISYKGGGGRFPGLGAFWMTGRVRANLSTGGNSAAGQILTTSGCNGCGCSIAHARPGMHNSVDKIIYWSPDSASNCSSFISISRSISSVSRALRSSCTSVKSETDFPSNSNALILAAELSASTD